MYCQLVLGFFLITVDGSLKVEHKLESVIQFGTNIDESQQHLYKPILNVLCKFRHELCV